MSLHVGQTEKKLPNNLLIIEAPGLRSPAVMDLQRGMVDTSKKYISLSRITLFIADYLSNSIRGAADAFGVATGPRG